MLSHVIVIINRWFSPRKIKVGIQPKETLIMGNQITKNIHMILNTREPV